MSTSSPRASELAAQQVEQIVSAAQEAAEEIRREARLEQDDLRRWAQEDSDDLLKQTQQDAEKMLEEARKKAVLLNEDALREAGAMIEDAREESARTREQTQRLVDGRVAAAEKAAADVLEEARALSGGLHQLGKSLEDHAERILRDVTAAHKRMQADLRVGGPEAGQAAGGDREPGRPVPPASPKSAPAGKSVAGSRANGPEKEGPPGVRRRPNPLDGLEVPPWVGDNP